MTKNTRKHHQVFLFYIIYNRTKTEYILREMVDGKFGFNQKLKYKKNV